METQSLQTLPDTAALYMERFEGYISVFLLLLAAVSVFSLVIRGR